MKHFFKAMSVAILLVAISIFYQSCQKESVINFELSVKDRSDNYAIITWSDLTNGTDGEYLYSVYLNSELIVENTIDNTYSFTNLTGNTSYQCRVVAKNEKLGTVESTKSFTTFINYPPTAFEINSDSITSTSFSLHWNTSDDPERRALKYTVFVNNVVCFENYTQKSLVVRGLNAATLNYIRVIAFDDQNNSTTSSLNIRTLQKSNAL
ncbi:MAG: fibronectin type III domain-containing protein, partial [Ignavibacteria bacterium]|nr:fibronectin type III domain-containing protein [Ignavibacteria bacterium]